MVGKNNFCKKVYYLIRKNKAMEEHNHFQGRNHCNLEMIKKNKLYLLNRAGKIKKIDDYQILINFVNNVLFLIIKS